MDQEEAIRLLYKCLPAMEKYNRRGGGGGAGEERENEGRRRCDDGGGGGGDGDVVDDGDDDDNNDAAMEEEVWDIEGLRSTLNGKQEGEHQKRDGRHRRGGGGRGGGTATSLQVRSVARLWAGMGHIYEVSWSGVGKDGDYDDDDDARPSTKRKKKGRQNRDQRKQKQQESADREKKKNNNNRKKKKIMRSVIIKRVSSLPDGDRQSVGDRRKADSYQVEANFYERAAPSLLRRGVVIPKPLYVERGGVRDRNDSTGNNKGDASVTICMSKLEGDEPVYGDVGAGQTRAVLRWLAKFHASTWFSYEDEYENEGAAVPSEYVRRRGLQPVGTYWHLDTRRDEHESMSNGGGWQGRLKMAARAIDERLKNDRAMRCCVHGDAKDENMIFFNAGGAAADNENEDDDDEEEPLRVGMYDFQYCGQGPPSKDLAYFLCVAASDDEDRADFVEYYHERLVKELDKDHDDDDDDDDHGRNSNTCHPDGRVGTKKKRKKRKPTLIQLNRSLELAYCDWVRFMCGWGFWGVDLTPRVVSVLDKLDGGTKLKTEQDYVRAVEREYGRN